MAGIRYDTRILRGDMRGDILTVYPWSMITEQQILDQWMMEAGRNEPIINLSQAIVNSGNVERPQGAHLQIDALNRLVVHSKEDEDSPLVICTFTGHRRDLKPGEPLSACFLVNDDDNDQEWLNQLVQRVYARISGPYPCMRIPFAAIEGAGIFPDTIRIIHGDSNYQVRDTYTITNVDSLGREPVEMIRGNLGPINIYGRGTGSFSHEHGRWDDDIWQVLLPNGRWHRLNREPRALIGVPQVYNTVLPPSFVFQAESMGGTHKYISAYDHLENPPMYFLAQLPDSSEATTLAEAFTDLQPPIVQKALQDGKDVRRHGDVFFIHTTEPPKETVLARNRDRQGRFFANPRRNFMIHETGHTAEYISVDPETGVTLVSGMIRHEPWLQPGDEDREAEHRPLQLPAGRWYLAVRNTVPTV